MAEIKVTESTHLQVIDGNAIGYASMYEPGLLNLEHKGVPTGGIHGTLMAIFRAMAEHPNAVPLVVWDGHAAWRKVIYPEYKANRTDKEDKVRIREMYRKQLPYIVLLLSRLGIPQVRCAASEADDVAGKITRNAPADMRIELRTRDTDWFQGLVRPGITWFSPVTKPPTRLDIGQLTDMSDPKADNRYTSVEEYLQAKSIAGDTSDNIQGVAGVGMATACKVIRENGGSVENLYRRRATSEKLFGIKLLAVASEAGEALYRRNRKIVDWSQGPAILDGDVAFTCFDATQIDWSEVEAEFDQFNLKNALIAAKRRMGMVADHPVLGRGQNYGSVRDLVHRALLVVEEPFQAEEDQSEMEAH